MCNGTQVLDLLLPGWKLVMIRTCPGKPNQKMADSQAGSKKRGTFINSGLDGSFSLSKILWKTARPLPSGPKLLHALLNTSGIAIRTRKLQDGINIFCIYLISCNALYDRKIFPDFDFSRNSIFQDGTQKETRKIQIT